MCTGVSAGCKAPGTSDETGRLIDEEVRNIVDQCYDRAKTILEDNIDKLHMMSDALMELETLLPEQLDDIMAGAKPRVTDIDESDATPRATGPDAPNIGDPAEEH